MLKYGLTDVQLDTIEELWVKANGKPFVCGGDLERAAILRHWAVVNKHLPAPKFAKHNHYDPEDLDLIYQHYNPFDCKSWPYYPIVMPLRKGRGPVSDKQCDEITWEVWDRFCNSVYSSKYLPDAINEAMRLNKEVFS